MKVYKTYIGTKVVRACPMTRGEYCEYKHWNIPKDEDPKDNGFLIRYSSTYESWKPEDAFYKIFNPSNKMSFGNAIEMVKAGEKCARKGWNGRHQYIELATNISYVSAQGDIINPEHECIGNKAIAFVGTSGVQLGWLASQADMLAEDWCVVD